MPMPAMRSFALRLAAAACLAPLCAAAADLKPVVTGTAHEALFGIAVDGSRAVAVGAGGAIMESADGGKTWKADADVPTPLSLLGVAMSKGEVIAVGQQGTVLLQTAPGKWSKADCGSDSRLFNVAIGGNVTAVVGSFGTVLRSGDGGKSWTSIAPDWTKYTPNGEQPHLYDVAVDDKGTITVAGEFGFIMRTADAGKTWKLLHKGSASIFAMELRPDGVGYAVGQDGALLRSADHGANWTELKSGSSAILLGVHSAPGGKVVVTGLHDMLVSGDDGKSWRHLGGEDVNTGWYQGVASPGPGQPLLAVGHFGEIVQVMD
jgi:photosystem II stability/assembly factor-like uncharacterized protein